MKKIYLPILKFIASLLLLTSCNNDDKEIVRVLTIKISPSYSPNSAEIGYFFVSDSLGAVLDTKKIEAGQDVKLSINKPLDKVNLTLCRLFKTETQEDNTFSTFLNVPISDQPIDFAVIVPPTPIGSAKITISNYTGLTNSLIVSNGFDNTSTLNGFVKPEELNNKILTTEVGLIQNNSEIVLTGLRKSNTSGYDKVYFSVKGVNINDNIEIDYNNFMSYSKKLDVNFTGTLSGSIMGFKGSNKDRGHWLFTTSFVSSLTYLGYLDGYDNYLTSLGSYKTNMSSSYSKFGSLPSSITFSEPTLNVTSKDINNFNFVFSEPYTFRTSSWFYSENNNYFSWYVRGEKLGQKIKLPEEILSKYNFLKIENLEYVGSTFTICKEGSYAGKIKEFFSGERINLELYQYGF